MENKELLVSVVMNCYNSDTYLKEAIDSVIQQTHENWEIIFWDNQSTDNSADIVASYNDSRIKYYYAPLHTSLGEGRNKALEKVKGKFVSFLDCDDIYLPSKIETTLEYFIDKSIGLVYTNGYTLFEEKKIKKEFYKTVQQSGDMFEKWIASYQVMIPSVMFRTEVLERLNYWFDEKFSMIEEYDFFMRISQDWKVNYADEKLCIWRAHSSSLSWSKRELFETEYKILLKKILKSNTSLEQKECIKHFKSKIAYHSFFNHWKLTGKAERNLLIKYFFLNKVFFLIYILSFFNFNQFSKILKFFGKNI